MKKHRFRRHSSAQPHKAVAPIVGALKRLQANRSKPRKLRSVEEIALDIRKQHPAWLEEDVERAAIKSWKNQYDY